MERDTHKELCDLGRENARKALAETGKTHNGKHGLGRKPTAQGAEIATWRQHSGASIADTAAHFGVSLATVKRYCATAAARKRKMAAVYAEVARLEERGKSAAMLDDIRRSQHAAAVDGKVSW